MAHLLMLAVVLLWGTTFVLVKAALSAIRPQWFNALRMMLAFACLAWLYRREWRRMTHETVRTGALAGTFLALGYFFQTQGLVYTTPIHSAFITALVVVLVPCLASAPWLRLAEAGRPTVFAWGGAIAAFAGVVLLTIPAHTPWAQMISSLNRGDALTLACALGFSLHVLTLARYARSVRFQQLALLQVGFAMVFLTLGALVTEQYSILRGDVMADPIQMPNAPLVIVSLLITGVLATAAAFSIQTWAQQVIPATNMAVILTLEPVFAWLTAFLVLRERMELRAASGAVLVLAATLATEVLPRWRPQSRPPSG